MKELIERGRWSRAHWREELGAYCFGVGLALAFLAAGWLALLSLDAWRPWR